MKRVQERFGFSMTPKFHAKKLGDLQGLDKPSKIFVCSSGDLFGMWVNKEWIESVLDVVKLHPQHTFQFLTKNPRRYAEFSFPENCWLGTSVDGTERTMRNLAWLVEYATRNGKKNRLFVSFEPLLENVYPKLATHENGIAFGKLDWIIVGADSNTGAEHPPSEWGELLVRKARMMGIPVWVKDNYFGMEKTKGMPLGGQNGCAIDAD